jgi:Domain of unknown function (DUF4349)
MATNFKRRFYKAARLFAALFLLMFMGRLLYGYLLPVNGNGTDYSDNFFGNIANLRKNYASEKFQYNSAQNQPAFASNQKFEKTASVKTKSAAFEQDEKRVKEKAKNYNAVVQYEQNLGQKGSREIHLMIGVNPASFDSFYTALQQIGNIRATEITKIDKTNEYRQLNAKKASIEKTLQSLIELKTRAGQISDFVALNDKILETEEKLQELGVELGNFDTENEFCTVRYSLYEGQTEKQISLLQRVRVALEWTLKYYALLLLGLSATLFAVFLLLLAVDKLKLLNSLAGRGD